MNLRYLLLLLCFGHVSWAQAEIYKYVDSEGHVTYTSTPIKGAKKLDLSAPNTSLAPAPDAPRRSETNPSDFPRVDSATQKSRDGTRRQILNDELATEEKLLAEALQNKKLAEDTPQVYRGQDGKTYRNVAKYDESVKAAQEEVSLHEKNIEALKSELGNLR